MEWWHPVAEHYGAVSALVSVLLFAGMMGCMNLGGRLAPAASRRLPVNAQGSGIIEGAVLALLGLLVAFTFSGAASRIGERNRVAIDEANAISTLYQRFDLLQARDADSLRALLLEYSLSRMEEYRNIKVESLHAAVTDNTSALRVRLWRDTLSACGKVRNPEVPQLLLPALNDVFNMADRREFVRYIHPPLAVYAMLLALSLISAVLAGYRLAQDDTRSWLHRASFAAVMALTLFITLNMEYPRFGLLDMGNVDRPLKSFISNLGRAAR